MREEAAVVPVEQAEGLRQVVVLQGGQVVVLNGQRVACLDQEVVVQAPVVQVMAHSRQVACSKAVNEMKHSERQGMESPDELGKSVGCPALDIRCQQSRVARDVKRGLAAGMSPACSRSAAWVQRIEWE